MESLKLINQEKEDELLNKLIEAYTVMIHDEEKWFSITPEKTEAYLTKVNEVLEEVCTLAKFDKTACEKKNTACHLTDFNHFMNGGTQRYVSEHSSNVSKFIKLIGNNADIACDYQKFQKWNNKKQEYNAFSLDTGLSILCSENMFLNREVFPNLTKTTNPKR